MIQQLLAAGAVDEFQVHIAPLFLGSGVRLFADGEMLAGALEQTRVIDSPGATHLKYTVS